MGRALLATIKSEWRSLALTAARAPVYSVPGVALLWLAMGTTHAMALVVAGVVLVTVVVAVTADWILLTDELRAEEG